MSTESNVAELETALKALSLSGSSKSTVADASVTAHTQFSEPETAFPALLRDFRTLEEEEVSPITIVGHGFLRREFERDAFASMYARAAKWCTDAGVTAADVTEAEKLLVKQKKTFSESKTGEFERIFVRDAERNYNAPRHRELLCHVLTLLKETTLQNDYHQGLSMIVAFLMLFLSTPQVIAMVFKANSDLRYVPDVWRSQSIAAATDGYVLESLLEEHLPAVTARYREVGVVPELYASKLWCAFGIHMLPFQSLVLFFDDIWRHGSLAIFRLALLIVIRQEKALVEATSVDRVLELLRFDPTVMDADTVNRVAYALSPAASASPSSPSNSSSTSPSPSVTLANGIGSNSVDAKADAEAFAAALARVERIMRPLCEGPALHELRADLYSKHLKDRIERANKDFEKAAVPNCASGSGKCPKKVGTGEYRCRQCNAHMCESCAYSAWGEHNDDDHEVRMNDDWEGEDDA